MKKIVWLAVFCIVTSALQAQAYKVKKKKKDFFGGAQDYRTLRNFGFQGQIGPTYTFTETKNKFETVDDGIGRTRFQLDPGGMLGVHAELGLAHFNLKKPKYWFIPMIHYYDYGVGFKLYSGQEATTVEALDNTGSPITSSTGKGTFQLGYVSLRASAHYLMYFKKGSRFLDNGFGFHGDYLVLDGKRSYPNDVPMTQEFSPKLRVQMHYDLGFGIRLKRGSYLIPGVQVPIVGLSPYGHESIRWFSSKYYPALFKIKWIYLFEKKGNGCTDNGTDDDRKKNKEYMQNK